MRKYIKLTKLKTTSLKSKNFLYTVRPINTEDNYLKFAEWREWCWELWGAGIELPYMKDDPKYNWGWDMSGASGVYRIYFKKEQDLTVFFLRWQ